MSDSVCTLGAHLNWITVKLSELLLVSCEKHEHKWEFALVGGAFNDLYLMSEKGFFVTSTSRSTRKGLCNHAFFSSSIYCCNAFV